MKRIKDPLQDNLGTLSQNIGLKFIHNTNTLTELGVTSMQGQGTKYKRHYMSPGYKDIQNRVKQHQQDTNKQIQSENSRSTNGLRYSISQLPGKKFPKFDPFPLLQFCKNLN